MACLLTTCKGACGNYSEAPCTTMDGYPGSSTKRCKPLSNAQQGPLRDTLICPTNRCANRPEQPTELGRARCSPEPAAVAGLDSLAEAQTKACLRPCLRPAHHIVLHLGAPANRHVAENALLTVVLQLLTTTTKDLQLASLNSLLGAYYGPILVVFVPCPVPGCGR